MGKSQEPLKVTCPCCKAKLSVDAALGVVLSHEEPPRKGPDVDLTNAAGILSEQQRQREDKFADSWFQETNKEDILAKKFEEAMKKAKDAPVGKPIVTSTWIDSEQNLTQSPQRCAEFTEKRTLLRFSCSR